jgi:hypothetical protein
VPIKTQIEDIIKEMYKIVKEFPIDSIPHITDGNEIKDTIHANKSKSRGNIHLDQARPSVKQEDINNALKEV